MDHPLAYVSVRPQVLEKTMPVTIMHPLDHWDILREFNWAPNKIEAPDSATCKFLHDLVPDWTQPKNIRRVYIWAALNSRESYETLIADPGLVVHYVDQAHAELNYAIYRAVVRAK